MNKTVRTAELFACPPPMLQPLFGRCEYPWEILPLLKDFIAGFLSHGAEGYTVYTEGILAGEGVRIHPTAVLIPPLILGRGTEIRPNAYLRGNVIAGENCVIGNTTEVKHSILLDGVQIPHYNYVGDSLLGTKAHLGAGAVCSNLKADGGEVVVRCDRAYNTGLRKLGGILGDGADIGCSCVLNPGTVVGRNTSVYPLTSLRGVYPNDAIVKSGGEIVERQ